MANSRLEILLWCIVFPSTNHGVRQKSLLYKCLMDVRGIVWPVRAHCPGVKIKAYEARRRADKLPGQVCPLNT